jgi:N-carbamoylputrescine amidase
MTEITVAALQLAFTNDIDANIKAVSELVREAAGKGAQVVLPPELFEGEYFCRVEDESLFANARPAHEHKAVLAISPPISASTSRPASSRPTGRISTTAWR